MRNFFLILAFVVSNALSAQMTEQELSTKLDSVLTEGNLLYKYEKSAWVSTDLAQSNKKIKTDFGGYLTYQDNEKFNTIILSKTNGNCIAEYAYSNKFKKPDSSSLEERELNAKEKNLLDMRDKILEQLSDPKYEVVIPDGFSLNFILIPQTTGYKLYVITGTSKSNIIPFGNDYCFFTDNEGKITTWQKFHSGFIPTQTKFDGNQVIEITHSHTRANPLMSATEICTFKLYGALCGLKEFSVFSPAIGKFMKYNLKKDKITTERLF